MLNVSSIDPDAIENLPLSEAEAPPDRSIQRFSLEPLNENLSENPWRYVQSVRRRPYRAEPFDHAAPLSPLRERDLEIIAGWFERVDMSEVEQDIDYHLSMLYPEPPWEDNLDLNFLKEHL